MDKTLSIIVLVKNEEKQIEDCLKSAQFADELILIDTGSTDRTVSLAKKYTRNILEVNFSDFSSLRNLGKEKANGDWLFYLDADEIISHDLKKEIIQIRQEAKSLPAYFVKRENYYLGKRWPGSDRMQRLFQRKKLLGWFGKVHETARVEGEMGELRYSLIHRTHNNLEEMLTNTIAWSDFEARARWEQHHPPVVWWRIFRVMLTAFYDSYIKQKGYQVGTEGLIESMYQAFSIFVTYAKLWELQQKNTGR